MGWTVRSPLRVRRPELVVDDPWDLVVRFFIEDRSSLGERSYDGYGQADPLRRTASSWRTSLSLTPRCLRAHRTVPSPITAPEAVMGIRIWFCPPIRQGRRRISTDFLCPPPKTD